MSYFQPCSSETTMVPGIASTAGPRLGPALAAYGPRESQDQAWTLDGNGDPFKLIFWIKKHQANQQHMSSLLLPCHPLALGLKANRIFAGRVKCSEQGKEKRIGLQGRVAQLPTPSGGEVTTEHRKQSMGRGPLTGWGVLVQLC